MSDPLGRALDQVPVVAILRGATGDRLPTVVDVLADAGLRCIELPLTTPGALEALAEAARRHDGDEIVLGAGTVLDADAARAAVSHGARFLVTPTVVPDVAEAAREAGVPVLMGALTPTEVLAAHRSGAWAVKLFPASLGGLPHLRALRDPLPAIPLVPTGGISVETAAEWLACGARAVGIGSPLVGDALAQGSLVSLRERAERLVSTLGAGR